MEGPTKRALQKLTISRASRSSSSNRCTQAEAADAVMKSKLGTSRLPDEDCDASGNSFWTGNSGEYLIGSISSLRNTRV